MKHKRRVGAMEAHLASTGLRAVLVDKKVAGSSPAHGESTTFFYFYTQHVHDCYFCYTNT